MAKAKRPNMLSEDVFRASLHEQKCHPKYVDAYLGDCKLRYNHIKRWSRAKNGDNHVRFTRPPPVNVVVLASPRC